MLCVLMTINGFSFDYLLKSAESGDLIVDQFPKSRYSANMAAVGEKSDIYPKAHTRKNTLQAGRFAVFFCDFRHDMCLKIRSKV